MFIVLFLLTLPQAQYQRGHRRYAQDAVDDDIALGRVVARGRGEDGEQIHGYPSFRYSPWAVVNAVTSTTVPVWRASSAAKPMRWLRAEMLMSAAQNPV